MAEKMRWREEEEEQGIDCMSEADPKVESSSDFSGLAQHQFPLEKSHKNDTEKSEPDLYFWI